MKHLIIPDVVVESDELEAVPTTYPVTESPTQAPANGKTPIKLSSVLMLGAVVLAAVVGIILIRRRK